MRRLLAPALVLASLALPLAASAQSEPADAAPDKPGTSKPWLRLEWLYGPRRFPHADVPPNAWHRAWLQKRALPVWNPRGGGLGFESLGAWEHMGPNATDPGSGRSWTGRIHAIAVNPTDPNTLYIGHAKGGVWKTTDGGVTWAPLTDGLSSQVVGCLTLDPVDPNTVYFGTGEEYFAGYTLGGVGIWKSTDGGATWTLKGNSTFAGRRINAISIDPTDTSRWVVCSDLGFHTTTDGGATFTLRKAGVGSALERHPTIANTLYGAMGWPFGGSTASANGVYKSTDGGVTWTLLAGPPTGTSAGRYELSICKGTPSVVYAVCTVPPGTSSAYLMKGVWKTTNGGSTWTQIATTSSFPNSWPQGWYDLAIKANPDNSNVCYVADVVPYKTTNSGATWTFLGNPGGHPDIHAIEILPGASSTVYLGQDSGLYISTDGGSSWTHRNSGRGTMEYYALDVHPTDPLALAAGAQDNSTHLRTAARGSTFRVVIGGDGFWAAYKRSAPTTLLGEWQFGHILRSTDGGLSWFNVLDLSGDAAPWSTPLINDPTAPSRFYAGTYRVWRSLSDGAAGTWAAISPDVTKPTVSGGAITDIKVAPSNGSFMYVGSSDGGFFVSANAQSAAPTWTARYAGLPSASVGGVEVDPGNHLVCYAGMQGFLAGSHVFKSTDAGATWTNITGNLPNIPVNSLAAHPAHPNTLFAATDNGVYVTEDGGATWAVAGSGLPSTMCTMLRVNPATGFLTVSTYGRGTWRLALGAGRAATTLACSNAIGARGQAVELKALLSRTASGSPLAGKTVEFRVDGVLAGTAATDSTGAAVLAYTIPATMALGAHALTARFPGDAENLESVSPVKTLKVALKTKTTLLGSDPLTGTVGVAKTYKAKLVRASNGTPLANRKIRFLVDDVLKATKTTNSLGVAAFTYTPPAGSAGSHTLTARFSPGIASSYAPSSATRTLSIGP